MKVYVKPSIEELAISNTAYYSKEGNVQDGVFKSNDGALNIVSFSGNMTKEEFIAGIIGK